MSRPTKSISNDTVRFHQIVEQGNLEGLKAALENGADINAPGHVGMTALMHAIAKKDLAKTTLLIRHGADPELTDDFNRTALCHAVEDDFEDGVRFLLRA
jgi:ankyrin repeat protein